MLDPIIKEFNINPTSLPSVGGIVTMEALLEDVPSSVNKKFLDKEGLLHFAEELANIISANSTPAFENVINLYWDNANGDKYNDGLTPSTAVLTWKELVRVYNANYSSHSRMRINFADTGISYGDIFHSRNNGLKIGHSELVWDNFDLTVNNIINDGGGSFSFVSIGNLLCERIINNGGGSFAFNSVNNILVNNSIRNVGGGTISFNNSSVTSIEGIYNFGGGDINFDDSPSVITDGNITNHGGGRINFLQAGLVKVRYNICNIGGGLIDMNNRLTTHQGSDASILYNEYGGIIINSNGVSGPDITIGNSSYPTTIGWNV